MPLGLSVLLAVFGTAALMFSIFGEWGKGKKEWRVEMGIAGLLVLTGSLVYLMLAFIFIDAV